jgi:hypothetical protein
MVAHGVFFKASIFKSNVAFKTNSVFHISSFYATIPFMVSGIEMATSSRKYGAHFKASLRTK